VHRRRLSEIEGMSNITQRLDRVYLTSDRELARACASVWSPDEDKESAGGGVLYVVQAVDPLEPDDDLPVPAGLSYQTASARVLKIYDPHVARNDAKTGRKLRSVLKQNARMRNG
jgi:hypothetical protein